MTEVDGWRLHAWGEKPRWESFVVGPPAAGEVLVEVEACGVGSTVLNCMNGDLDDSGDLLPRTPGHEVVGVVTEVGEGVREPRVGDRVMSYFYLSCLSCRACLSGRESRCLRLAGWYGVHRDGGYAPLTLLPAGNALPLDFDLPPAEASVIPDAVATPVHVCVDRLRLGPGDRVAVLGAGGGVGAHMIQVAAACGAAVAGLERTPDKLALIEELGVVPIDSADLRSVRLGEFDGRVDAVIDLVGSRETLAWAWDALAIGGRLCVLTTFRDVDFRPDPRDFVFKEGGVIGSRYASRAELLRAAELVASGSVRAIVGAIADPRDAEDLHEDLRAGRLRGRGALVWN